MDTRDKGMIHICAELSRTEKEAERFYNTTQSYTEI
jgi:hypothetical protein